MHMTKDEFTARQYKGKSSHKKSLVVDEVVCKFIFAPHLPDHSVGFSTDLLPVAGRHRAQSLSHS